jgi:hypothetical protein
MVISLIKKNLFKSKNEWKDITMALKGVQSQFCSEGTRTCHFTFPTLAPNRRVTAEFQEVSDMVKDTSIIIEMNILLALKLVIDLKNLKLIWNGLELSLETKEMSSSEAVVVTVES